MQAKPKRGRRPRRRGPSTSHTVLQHTSVPTGPKAYAETRRWLVEQHGPICAYCGVTWPPRTLTLDHVTPRKGQTAYDRRDNLVLACKRCNTAKADKPFLVYLLAQKSRAANLLRYGEHLSEGILDLVRHVAGGVAPSRKKAPAAPRIVYGADDDEESPYAETVESPYKSEAKREHKSAPKPVRKAEHKPARKAVHKPAGKAEHKAEATPVRKARRRRRR